MPSGKSTDLRKTGSSVIRHADLWGLRQICERTTDERIEIVGGKYHWLSHRCVSNVDWEILKPQSPFYLFVPCKTSVGPEYQEYTSVRSIFVSCSNGFKTHRDHFSIAFEKRQILDRIAELLDTSRTDSEISLEFDLRDTRDWKISEARRRLSKEAGFRRHIIKCLYRPMDIRYCLYGDYIMDWPRTKQLSHSFYPNMCMAIGRQGLAVGDRVWNLITVGNMVADTNLFRRGGIQYFPLYLYRLNSKETLFDGESREETENTRVPNFHEDFADGFARKLGMSYAPERKAGKRNVVAPQDFFNYTYTILHSPAYRLRYAEFLKIDFPRLPLTSNKELFRELCRLGERLVDLHLMNKHGEITTRYPEAGDNCVEKVRYTEPGQGAETGRVWINKRQYFDNVSLDVWEFRIGGYQVCEKWLLDRKGRNLTYDDLTHYQRIVSALRETIRLMADIDETIENHGGWPIR